MFWSSIFYREAPESITQNLGILFLEPLWTISLLSNVTTIGILLLFSYSYRPLAEIKLLPKLAAISTSLGTLLISHTAILVFNQSFGLLYIIGSVLTGIGSAIIVVLWGELFASLGSKRTVNYFVAAIILAALAFSLLAILPNELSQMLTSLLPLISIAYFLKFRSSIPHLSFHQSSESVHGPAPYKLIAISLFFGLSFGFMKGLFPPIIEELTNLRDFLNIIGIAGGSIAVLITTSYYKMDLDHMTYQVALPLMAAGFLFLPLQSPWNVFGTGVHQFGYQYFYIVLWAIWPVIVSRAHVPAAWINVWSLFSIQFGQLLGSVISGGILSHIDSDASVAMLSASIIFLILLIALFALGSESPNTGWGYVKPNEEKDPSSDFDKACTKLTRLFKLTPREIEVFFLLAKGRNRPYIKEELVISDETVKSHIKNIYRKIDVHSQQELIDLIELESQSLSSG